MVAGARFRVSSTPASKASVAFLDVAQRSAEELDAAAVVVLSEASMDWSSYAKPRHAMPMVVATSSEKVIDSARAAGLPVVELEPLDVAIGERITLSLIEGVAQDYLQAGALVLVVYSAFESGVLDSMSLIRLGEHLERLTSRDLRALETSVPFDTLRAVVDIAIEIGREGREGNPVGTLIVVGDSREVLERSHTLGFDPFKGYRRKDRNIRDGRVREAIKEIAQLDGAFVVSRDGTVEAACRMIDAPITGITLPKGLGTRHWAAAAITRVTNAVAVVVSQSTGSVRLFQGGEIVLRIAPMRHARAMKWQLLETEPPASRSERDRA